MLQIQRKSPVTVENATLLELHQHILLKAKKKKKKKDLPQDEFVKECSE